MPGRISKCYIVPLLSVLLAVTLILLSPNLSFSELLGSWKWNRAPYDLVFLGDDLVINNGNFTDSNGTSYGPRLARFTKYGVQQWIQTYPANATPQRIIATQDGGVAVAGWKWTGVGSNYQAAVWKFSSSGVLAWESVNGGSGIHLFFDLAEMSDGSLIAVGNSEGSFDGSSSRGGKDAIAARLTSAGTLIWKTQEGGAGDDYFTAVDVAPTGEIMAVGYSSGTFLGTVNQGGFDGVVVEFSSDGDVIWHTTVATSQEDQLEDVLFYHTTSAIVVGSISGDTGLVARITSGFVSWTHETGTPPSDQFTRVKMTSTGTFWVGGLIDTEVVLKEMATSGAVLRERTRPKSAGDIMGLTIDSADEVWTAHYEGWIYGGIDNPVPNVSLAASASIVQVNASVTFTATANVVGGSIITYEWDLNGDGTYETSGGSSQVASWATLGDKVVRVRVTSESGITNTAQKTVSVGALPSSPTDVTASLSGRQARIQWQPPASNGGTPILDYHVRSTDSSVSCSATGTECSISNLTPGSAYQFEVAARNALGLGGYTSSQSVTVADPSTAVLSASTTTALTGSSVVFDASGSSAASGRALTYRWDMNGDGVYEKEGGSQVSHSWATVGTYVVRVQVTGPDGSIDSASASVVTYLAPPDGEVGVSINEGYPYTNTKHVTVDVVWPPFATELRASNDGGFRSNQTEKRQLSARQRWTLDDRVKGQFTKIVYVRFRGLKIDPTRTFSDDIIFDNTVPEITSASASLMRTGSAKLHQQNVSAANSKGLDYLIQMRAKDNRSGMSSIQVSAQRSERAAITRTYGQRVIITIGGKQPLKWLWVRVKDRADNWSAWRKVKVG